MQKGRKKKNSLARLCRDEKGPKRRRKPVPKLGRGRKRKENKMDWTESEDIPRHQHSPGSPPTMVPLVPTLLRSQLSHHGALPASTFKLGISWWCCLAARKKGAERHVSGPQATRFSPPSLFEVLVAGLSDLFSPIVGHLGRLFLPFGARYLLCMFQEDLVLVGDRPGEIWVPRRSIDRLGGC